MTAAVLVLWAGCAKQRGVDGPLERPADGEAAAGCVVSSPTAEGEPVYPLIVHPVDRSRAVWQEARFRYETGLPWTRVQVRSDGVIGQAMGPAAVRAPPDEQLRAIARQAEFFGLVDPSAAEWCEIRDREGGGRSLRIQQSYGGRVIGELRIDWVQPHGTLALGSSLVPGLTEPLPDQLSDEALTARVLEQIGDEGWRVWAQPEPRHPCDCADRACKACNEYARSHAERYFEPVDAPIRLTPDHFRWERAFVRLLTPEGTEEVRLVAFATLRPLASEVPPKALAAARIGVEAGSEAQVMVDAVTGEELVRRQVTSSTSWPAP